MTKKADQAEVRRLLLGLNSFNRCRVMLLLAHEAEAAGLSVRYPVDVAQRIHLARELWQRRN